ncbi:hypothetical protein GCM10027062_22310 [Nocardioides hungaricus]
MAATSIVDVDPVLAAAREAAEMEAVAQVRKLQLAVEWALQHPGYDRSEHESWAMRPLELAGDGAPTIDEAAVAEFALAIGCKHEPGANLIGDALELVHRLPKVWARVLADEVPVWKARKIAQATRSLPLDAAAAVDRHLALIARKCSFAEIDRQVEKARAEYDPAETERRRIAAAEKRHVKFHFHSVTSDGLVAFSGITDLADAVAVDTLLTAKAATLDPALPLDVRRSMALGLLGDTSTGKEVVLYTHTRPGQDMVEVDNTRSVVTPEQVREWCQAAVTKVTVRPVIDLAEELTTDVHDPTPPMREQAWARHPTCVFPHCQRPSRGCDLDHRIPYPAGLTTTWNLYPLCRTHHRLKTTGGWNYRTRPDGTIEWTSPAGLRHTA